MSITTRVGAVLTGTALLLSLGNFSVGASSATSQDQGFGAIEAADQLASGAETMEFFTTDLISELGYSPELLNGLAVNPDGDCSSPIPLPASFEPACMTHDLGYDLLRVADRTGQPIPPHTRTHLDRQMAEQMKASCDAGDAGCVAMASVAHAAVAANTIRQGHGAPVEEWFPW